MEFRDAVVICIKAAGGKLPGRTVVQKLLYFAAQKGLVDDVFSPHYYGPYSEMVLNSLNSLVSLDFLREEIESGESFFRDWKRYIYHLTDDGSELAKSIQDEMGEECRQLENIVQKAKKITDLNVKTLSGAAKVHYIVKKENRPMEPAEIKKEALKIGWFIFEPQIEQAIDFLKALDLVKEN